MECKYAAHKLEFLTLKWAITNEFHVCLYSNSFAIYTDNNILTTARLDATDPHWVASLPNYNIAIYYNLEMTNVDLDALS